MIARVHIHFTWIVDALCGVLCLGGQEAEGRKLKVQCIILKSLHLVRKAALIPF